MYATYNITNNKLRLFTDGKLPDETHKRLKDETRLKWWAGQKCWGGAWDTSAIDFIESLGIEIEDDDTPDNVAARVDRYTGYMQKATKRSDDAADRIRTGAANTDRRLRFASAKAEREADKAA